MSIKAFPLSSRLRRENLQNSNKTVKDMTKQKAFLNNPTYIQISIEMKKLLVSSFKNKKDPLTSFLILFLNNNNLKRVKLVEFVARKIAFLLEQTTF